MPCVVYVPVMFPAMSLMHTVQSAIHLPRMRESFVIGCMHRLVVLHFLFMMMIVLACALV
jgi:hypothetical protein